MSAAENPFDRILVSLDGSDFAERALPIAKAFGRKGVAMHLVAVPEIYGIDTAWYAESASPGSSLSVPLTDLLDEAKGATKAYLEETAGSMTSEGLTVQVHLSDKEPGDAIIATADEVDADMIVLATHGRGGITRWAFGSVAEHVLHNSPRPLLLVRASQPAAKSVDHIMVTLDGSDRAERILNDVVPMAKLLEARVTLTSVIQEPESFPKPSLLDAQKKHLEDMRGYLSTKVGELEAAGIEAVGEELTGESVAEVLLDREARGDIDLVAMTTHGRTGLARAALGSVADRVIRNGEVPVLVRRVV